MKINWGFKIVLFYAGFMTLIVSMVTLAMRERIDLVSKDYYQQEIAFQEKLDRSLNSDSLHIPLQWEVESASIIFRFPAEFKPEELSGDIVLFRPSDKELDRKFTVSASIDGSQVISTDDLAKGVYKIQVHWEGQGKKYYNEGVITIQ